MVKPWTRSTQLRVQRALRSYTILHVRARVWQVEQVALALEDSCTWCPCNGVTRSTCATGVHKEHTTGKRGTCTVGVYLVNVGSTCNMHGSYEVHKLPTWYCSIRGLCCSGYVALIALGSLLVVHTIAYHTGLAQDGNRDMPGKRRLFGPGGGSTPVNCGHLASNMVIIC